MRELTHAAAGRLARQLLANAAAWARTILICVGRRDPGVEEKLASEALAYSLCLLGERLKRTNGSNGFLELVRSNCARIMDERAWWRSNRHRRVTQGSSVPDASDFSQKLLAHAKGTEPRFGLSEEAFEEFCRATGLGSSVLFGRGENLAALVFYILAHGCVSWRARLSRQQTKELLRATRKCRMHTEAFLEHWSVGENGELLECDLPLNSPGSSSRLAARVV